MTSEWKDGFSEKRHPARGPGGVFFIWGLLLILAAGCAGPVPSPDDGGGEGEKPPATDDRIAVPPGIPLTAFSGPDDARLTLFNPSDETVWIRPAPDRSPVLLPGTHRTFRFGDLRPAIWLETRGGRFLYGVLRLSKEPDPTGQPVLRLGRQSLTVPEAPPLPILSSGRTPILAFQGPIRRPRAAGLSIRYGDDRWERFPPWRTLALLEGGDGTLLGVAVRYRIPRFWEARDAAAILVEGSGAVRRRVALTGGVSSAVIRLRLTRNGDLVLQARSYLQAVRHLLSGFDDDRFHFQFDYRDSGFAGPRRVPVAPRVRIPVRRAGGEPAASKIQVDVLPD